ncbi:hypothetical protein VaNZ11_016176 [Volvox africanus]|uniref:SLC26A/SulP transporter domain-containing protein n=1 Tax=Volvox africanus TaxID=51714 RepID=A0ABQ5SNX7_9CHLO|nr:hypothetical protein VaNZ11_016176 [Volvox africanus]
MGGVFVSICVLLMGITRLVELFNWLIPPPVLRGVQLAVGAKLAVKGIDMALRVRATTDGSTSPSPSSTSSHWRPVLGSEGLLVGALALAGLIATTVTPRVSRSRALRSREAASEEGSLGPRPTDLDPSGPRIRRLAQRCDPAAHAGGGSGDETGATERSALLGCSRGDGSSRGGAADPESCDAVCHTAAGGGLQTHTRVCGDCADAASGSGGGGGDGSGGGRPRTIPSALVAVVIGLLVVVASHPELLRDLKLGPSVPRLLRPSWSDLREGVLRAGLPQLPLTTLNSVIAVSQLADSLFQERRDFRRWRPNAVALSVGIMGLLGCWLGAMPCCHGAGGLAAQNVERHSAGHRRPVLQPP